MSYDYKKDFPLLLEKPVIYLDTAATSQKPFCVLKAMDEFYRHEYATVHRAIYDLSLQATQKYEEARLSVQKFLNAKEREEIIFVKGTTEGINLVASSFCQVFVSSGDEILITQMEHHANIVPWQVMAQQKGAHLKVASVNQKGELDLADFKRLLTSRTKIVAVTHMANTTGIVNPLEDIIEMAHQVGAKVLVDGAQSVTSLSIDVQKLDLDFFLFSAHKAYGPNGVGVLYGKKEILEALPPYQYGGDMVDKVSFDLTTYQPLPLKFEAGTPLIGPVVGLGAAIEYMTKISITEIHEHTQRLSLLASEKLRSVSGLKILGESDCKGPIISFVLDRLHPLDLASFLNMKNICLRTGHLCAQPILKHFGYSSVNRVSFGIYNNENEVEQLVAEIKNALAFMA
ncbi:MAG: aminotransferase class V-fold PLP-dependent enzyme [Rhabdochlamydiaceae bacterium]